MDLHLIVDDYGTHTHPRVQRWFRNLTAKRIRRGSFQSVPELIATIDDYLAQVQPKPPHLRVDRVGRQHFGEDRQM